MHVVEEMRIVHEPSDDGDDDGDVDGDREVHMEAEAVRILYCNMQELTYRISCIICTFDRA